ncbi:kinase, putative [Ricinus communis]|uniref:non-specific serine/threonine protein kinase n=1 Tax=Ricinus communis TaxID=3988 RepID=B9S2V0_RICCO|nr:kinase, putative [Ricinus communis]|eukprot:XP_002520319.1 probable receptor-like protein kinase At1g11050 isoform X2 [Ricinus communis]
MGNKQHLLSSFLYFFLFAISASYFSISASSSSSCPIDFSYVQTTPWDTSGCRKPDQGHCCVTLLSLFGMGLAQHLRETSMFQLANATAQASCLSDFQAKLGAMSIESSLVPTCFDNPNQFVANASSCVGINTTQDWTEKVGPMTTLQTSCKGDVSGLTQCSSCLEAGQKVTSQLTSIDPNTTSKCFYFTCLYAAAIVNEFGPMNASTAGCILGLPLTGSAINNSSKSSKKDKLLKLVFGFIGAVLGALIAFGVIIWYRRYDKKRKLNASHEEYVSSFRASVLPNSGAKWFHFSELERATNGFSQKNFIGQGTYGVVYKGTLADGTIVAVKQMQDSDSQGDEEFSNEVEIISKIRHRNLLSLRGCCVTSDHLRGKRRYLVYDFMSNGSLSDHLSSEHSRKQLTWPHRKNIVLDVAKGLAYLHYGIKPAIYHRDIKSTNILLDMEMKAKVADFGLAKQSLEDWAWMLAKSGKTEQIFDESIREQGPKGVMERFVLVGMLCAHVMVAFRPTIADALKMLEGDIDIPKLPDRPTPLSHESFKPSFLYNSSTTSERSRTSSSSMSLA